MHRGPPMIRQSGRARPASVIGTRQSPPVNTLSRGCCDGSPAITGLGINDVAHHHERGRGATGQSRSHASCPAWTVIAGGTSCLVCGPEPGSPRNTPVVGRTNAEARHDLPSLQAAIGRYDSDEFDSPERCPSGLRNTIGNRVCGKPYRGFESLPLRLVTRCAR